MRLTRLKGTDVINSEAVGGHKGKESEWSGDHRYPKDFYAGKRRVWLNRE